MKEGLSNYNPDTVVGGGVRKSEPERAGQISRISGVFITRRSELVFVGWTSFGNPIAGNGSDILSLSARRDYQSFEDSSLEPKRIPYSDIFPVDYSCVGTAIDFKDTEEQKAEDQVILSIKRAEDAQEIQVTERVILKAIVDAREEPWQEINHSGSIGEMVIVPREMYTLFLPTKRGEKSGLAVLFKPSTSGESNRAVFKVFVQEVLTRLLVLDEGQRTKKSRKGYLEAVSEVTKGKRRIGLVQKVLRGLQDGGFIDIKEETIVNPKGGLVAAILEKARDYFDIDITDADIEMVRNPIPDYDLKSFDLRRLFGLAEKMLQKAEEFLS